MRTTLLASLLAIAVLACGDDEGGSAVDAAPIGHDSAPHVAACGIQINQSIFTTTEPIIVVFGDAAGDLLSDTVADGTGAATKDDCSGITTITAVIDAGRGTTLFFTYEGVLPGQTVVLGEPIVTPPANPNSTLSVTLSAGQPGTARALSTRAGWCIRTATNASTAESRNVSA